MTSPRMPIHNAAAAFVGSYQRAMELAAPGSPHASNTPLVAAALAAHYGQTHIFVLGSHSSLSSTADATSMIQSHLERFLHFGLGLDVRLVKHRVEPLSDATAMCWVTWGIRPANGVAAWEWENMYVYRRAAAGGPAGEDEGAKQLGEGSSTWTKPEGRWEVVIGDNETTALADRVPGFFQ